MIRTLFLFIVSLNGDGARGYVAVWTVKDGVYNERFVTHGF